MSKADKQNSVTIPRQLLNQLLHHAQASPDCEICGLIGAKQGVPSSCYPIANVAASPATRFQLDAQGQVNAMRTMREQGEQLFAIFHSHPSTAAQPSPEDLAQAAYADALYLIISLHTTGVLEMRGFRLLPSVPALTFKELVLSLEAA